MRHRAGHSAVIVPHPTGANFTFRGHGNQANALTRAVRRCPLHDVGHGGGLLALMRRTQSYWRQVSSSAERRIRPHQPH
jgi:hypothetical protein